jgi:hypothetical protein
MFAGVLIYAGVLLGFAIVKMCVYGSSSTFPLLEAQRLLIFLSVCIYCCASALLFVSSLS